MSGAGVPDSDRPDPLNVVQEPLEVSIGAEILSRLRAGSLSPIVPRFEKFVQIGHSLGSIISNGVIIHSPAALDAVILTGVSNHRCRADPR